MAITNRERVGKGLDLLSAGLRPFVERELKSHLGDKWTTCLPDATWPKGQKSKAQAPNLDDPQVLLGVMWDQWNAVFRDALGPAERSLVGELRGIRNQWAHHEQFISNDAIRCARFDRTVAKRGLGRRSRGRSRPDAHGPHAGRFRRTAPLGDAQEIVPAHRRQAHKAV